MSPEVIVDLEDVWVHYDGVPVLEGISLSIAQDDFLAVIGPNGGGKTTLLKVILGLVKPSRGRVSVLQEPPSRGRTQVGYVPQLNLFDRDFPIAVRDVVLAGRYSKAGLFRRYGEEDERLAKSALQTVGMLEYWNRQVGKLSGGQQQRVFIARSLVSEPRLLLLDEPTSNVDRAAQSGLHDLLRTLKERMAIVLVSHDVGALSTLVDKLACLNRRLFYHGTKEIEAETLESVYECPIQMITHGTVPHWVLGEH